MRSLILAILTCLILAGTASAAPTGAGEAVGVVVGEACNAAEGQCGAAWAIWEEHLGEILPPPCRPSC